MGVREIAQLLEQWEMDARDLRRRMILAPTPQERERWHAIWLLAQGWTASATAEALERDPHTIGRWLAAFGKGGPGALMFEQSGGSPGQPHSKVDRDGSPQVHRRTASNILQTLSKSVISNRSGVKLAACFSLQIRMRLPWGVPPALGETQQTELKAAVQELPSTSGIGLANGNWKGVRQFVSEQFSIRLSRSSCLNYLHRLGFVLKRPKKRLVKANDAKREAFVAEYAALLEEARRSGGKIFFAGEAHFRADAELRGKWGLRGEPALLDSTSPRRGEKASYYSAVCLETGEVEWMELEGNSNAGISAVFLRQLRERRPGPLNVIWDNAPARRGEAVREYLRRPGLGLGLVNLPGYSPDFNADEAIWGWVREEATGNPCLGTKDLVQQKVSHFLAGLASRKEEVKRRCRTVLQSRAGRLVRAAQPNSQRPANAHPTLALV